MIESTHILSCAVVVVVVVIGDSEKKGNDPVVLTTFPAPTRAGKVVRI